MRAGIRLVSALIPPSQQFNEGVEHDGAAEHDDETARRSAGDIAKFNDQHAQQHDQARPEESVHCVNIQNSNGVLKCRQALPCSARVFGIVMAAPSSASKAARTWSA